MGDFWKNMNFYLLLKKNMSKNIGKNVSSKYSQKTLYHAKKSVTDVLKTTSKIVIQKTAEATDNLIGNKTEKII